MKKNLKNSFECVQGRRSYKLLSLFFVFIDFVFIDFVFIDFVFTAIF